MTLRKCSFCRKSETRVRKLILGPDVYICDQCVYMCLEILEDEGFELPPDFELRKAERKAARERFP